MTFSKSAIPPVIPAVWQFYVSHDKRPDGIRACGSVIYADCAEEVQELARRSGLTASQHAANQLAIKRDGALPITSRIRIVEPENSHALREIILGLRDLYEIDLAQKALVANETRPFFSVRKLREFTESQIEKAQYLIVYGGRFMSLPLEMGSLAG